jgi:outer membrane protein
MAVPGVRKQVVFAGIVLLFSGLASAQQSALRLTLGDAEKLALQNNPRVPAAQFLARAAAQITAEQKSAYQPAVAVNITGVGADNGSRLAAGALNNPVVYDRLASGIIVNQFIADFGRTHNLIEASKLRAQAQEQDTELTKDQIVLQTDSAYFAVLRALSLLSVARETVKARQLVVEQVNALAQSKLKSSLDVSFANVNLADAQLQLASDENEQKAAEAALATAIGLPLQTAFTLTEEPLPPTLPPDVTALVQDAIQKRPDLAELRLQVNAAQRFASAEHDLVLPTIAAIGTAGYVPAGQPQIPGRYGAVGVNVNIPIFNGGLFAARRTEAELRSSVAEQNLRDLENRISQDVKIAWLNAATANQRMGLTAHLLDQAQLALDLARNRYNLGLSSIVELSQAQLNLTSAQIANTSAKYDYQTRRAILNYQLGSIR